jgi:hypothetical protein
LEREKDVITSIKIRDKWYGYVDIHCSVDDQRIISSNSLYPIDGESDQIRKGNSA